MKINKKHQKYGREGTVKPQILLRKLQFFNFNVKARKTQIKKKKKNWHNFDFTFNGNSGDCLIRAKGADRPPAGRLKTHPAVSKMAIKKVI